MKNKPILVVSGEPKSIFFEIFFKSIKSLNFNCPLILIYDKKKISKEKKKYNCNKEIQLIKFQ